jgi:ABC-2 type transport system permease protein
MLLLSTAVLLPSGQAGTTWNLLPWPRLSLILFYGLVTSALWEAPVFGWMLLVSSWARRATFLWAVLPWLAISAIEKLAFDTTYFSRMLVSRLTGGFEQGFVVVKYPKDAHVPIVDRLTQLDPFKFLSSPGVWIGLVIAVVFLTAAIRFRRSRGPL